MITYDSFLRAIKISSITGECDPFIDFLISVKDNGRYSLIEKRKIFEPYSDQYRYVRKYEYMYNDIIIFSFKYRFTPYDINISNYFYYLCNKKYVEVYNKDLTSTVFLQRYIRDYLGYNNFYVYN